MTNFINPWEIFDVDCSSQKIMEPPDLFNNIKLTDFPFLKCNSTLDYLIKCKLCNVLLLPESISVHYENRHSNVCAEKAHLSVLLPYEAVSWCEDNSDNCTKRDRPIKRSKVLPLKRPKRVNCINSDLSSFESEGKSNMQVENNRKTIISTNNDHNEVMREPVLLKLAKSDAKQTLHHEAPKLYTKVMDEAKSNDRSVWSVVYSKDQPRFEVFNTITKRNNHSEAKFATKDNLCEVNPPCGYSSDLGFNSRSLTHVTSYPPTSSPHLHSSNLSNTSDDANIINHNPTRIESSRPISGSSTHSSSSSGATHDQTQCAEKHVQYITANLNPLLHVSPSGVTISGYSQSPKQPHKTGRFNSISSVNLTNNKTYVMGSHAPYPSLGKQLEVSFDNEIEAAVFHLENANQNVKCDANNVTPVGNKSRTKKNGFHNWLGDIPYLMTDKGVRKSILTLQRSAGTTHSSMYAIQSPPISKQRRGTTAYTFQKCMSDQPDFIEPMLKSPSMTTRAMVELNKCNSTQINNFSYGHCNLSFGSMDMALTQSVEDSLSDDIEEDQFDPLTQCGCVEIDDIKCKNSILCTVHKIEEKRLVPRPRELRYLMREARQKQHFMRQVSNQRQLPWTSQTCPAVIDLTDEPFVNDGSSSNPNCPGSVVGARRTIRSQILRRTNTYNSPEIHTSNRCASKILDNRYMTTSHHYSNDPNCQANAITPAKHNPIIDNGQTSLSQLPAHSRLATSEMYSSCDQEVRPETVGYSSKYSSTYAPSSYFTPTVIGDRTTGSVHQTRLHSTSTAHNVKTWPNRSNPKHPIDSMANLDSLVSHGSVFDEDEMLMLQSGYNNDNTNTTRKLSIPVTEQMNPNFIGATNLYSQISHQHRFTQDSQVIQSADISDVDAPNRYIHEHVYRTNQVVRETQGRVIVDDIREKSITGRSRKTARTVLRPSGSSFQGASFSNCLQFTNYHYPHQPVQIPSTSGYSIGRKSVLTSAGSSSSTDIAKAIAFTSMEPCNSKNSSTPLLEPGDNVDLYGLQNECFECLPTTVNSSSVANSMPDPPVNQSLDSHAKSSASHFKSGTGGGIYSDDFTLVSNSFDTNIRIFSHNAVAPSFPTLSMHSNSNRTPNYAPQHHSSHLVNHHSLLHGRAYFAQSIGIDNEATTTVAPSTNRYLVIRPSAIKQSTNLLLRTRRGNNVPNCSTNTSSVDES